MSGRVASLYRHPVKGFTPERLSSAVLETRAFFPGDRLYAVENGPSGFDPSAAKHVSKARFTVLANCPALARARTAYDETTGLLSVETEGQAPFLADLTTEAGRESFAVWLTGFLGEADLRGPLRVLPTSGAHRFTDSPKGLVSLINLESVRDLERRLGQPVDPLRFRANLYVEGWPAWSELELEPGSMVRLGRAEAEAVQPILRCAATHVDTRTGERDLDIVGSLRAFYGHAFCGVYLNTTWGGLVAEGDAAERVTAPAFAGCGIEPERAIEPLA